MTSIGRRGYTRADPMGSTTRVLSTVYAAAIFLLVAWAWVAYIRFAHSPQEHLLPTVVLLLASRPTSFLLELCSEWNSYCGGEMGQLGLLTCCAIGQAGLLASMPRLVNSALDPFTKR
jgi:hypothetical protein